MSLAVDLEVLMREASEPAARVLALLYYDARFVAQDEATSFASIFARLGIKRWTNPSVQVDRIVSRLNAILPVQLVRRSRVGREGFLALSHAPASLQLTWRGTAVTEAWLADFLRLERPSRVPRGMRLREGELLRALSDVVSTDLAVHSGDFELGGRALRDVNAMASGRLHRSLRLWAVLQELRLLRLAEEWGSLAAAVQRAKRWVARDAQLPPRLAQTVEAAADISSAWIDYHRVRSEEGGSYDDVVRRLEPMPIDGGSAYQGWVQCERYNLLSLALRRKAVQPASDEDKVAAREWAARSLLFNDEAMQLASLGGNPLSLAAYMTNRALILADLLDSDLLDPSPQSIEPWMDAIRWLALGENLARRRQGGSDTLWSGPYLLTIARQARSRGVAWPDLHAALMEHSPWYASLKVNSLIDAAVEFSSPAMDNMVIQSSQSERDSARFARQLMVLSRELTDAAAAIGESLKARNSLAALRTWARRTRKASPEADSVLGRFLQSP